MTRRPKERKADEEIEETFPASDPPAQSSTPQPPEPPPPSPKEDSKQGNGAERK